MTLVPATPETIDAAAKSLRAGGLVAFPTETVYGLGADATNGLAVAGLYAAKGRPSFNPLIVHVPETAAASALAEMTPLGKTLAGAFWPGALTLVLARRPNRIIADLATAGLDTIAVRVPAHPDRPGPAAGRQPAHRRAQRQPLRPCQPHDRAARRSRSRRPRADDPRRRRHVRRTGIDRRRRRPATRPSSCASAALRATTSNVSLGQPVAIAGEENVKPSSPGMLARHYAPATRLRLDARDVRAGEALLAFGAQVPVHTGPTINLSPSGDLAEAAANLFAALRDAGCRRRHGHCRHADPGVWPGRSHQRPPASAPREPNERYRQTAQP